MEVHPEGAETILIVDDDELVRKSAATLIASLGYRVLSAGSGPEALELLCQDTPIDVLFTDVFMPGGLHGPQLVSGAPAAAGNEDSLHIGLFSNTRRSVTRLTPASNR